MKPNYSLFLINQIGIAYRTPGHVNNTYLFKKKNGQKEMQNEPYGKGMSMCRQHATGALQPNRSLQTADN